MRFIWICALLLASTCYYAKAQVPDDYEDYYNYDNFEDLEKKIDEEINKLNEKTDIDNDLKVEEEIQQFRAGEDNSDAIDDPKETIDNIDDYQFEDNRDKSKEEANVDKKELLSDNDAASEDLEDPIKAAGKNDYEFEDNRDMSKEEENGDEKTLLSDSEESEDKDLEEPIETADDYDAENRPEPDDKNAPSRNEDYALLWGDDSVAPLPVPESPETDEDKAILEETKKILIEDPDKFEDEIKKIIGEVDTKTNDQSNLEEIVEETKKLLTDTDDSFNNDEQPSKVDDTESDKVDNDKKDVEPEIEEKVENKDENGEEDTVDKAYADLNADLDKLFATLDKLREDSGDDNLENMDKALEEADNFFEDNSDDLDSKNLEGSEELVEDFKEDDPIDLDKLLEDILNENDMEAEDMTAEKLEPLINDALNEPNPDDAIEKDVESLDSKLKPILYLNDALIDEAKDAETLENNDENAEKADNPENASVEKETEVKTTSIDQLTSAELDDLVSQFAIMHSEDLDIHSKNFEKNVAPVHIKLNLDEPTIITSPNYPNPYPTNNIVDWIVEGEGVGIELNITEFAVNGALGDYLLIKPGGVDDSGHDGLLFTYRLTSERRYRFTDVDRLFIRFESKLGMMFFRGFVISAKMIASIPEGPEPIPEPEAVLSPPHSTVTLTLAVTVRDFLDMKEDFRLLLADMAEEYIKDNNVDPGLNTTAEVTQITRVGLCPMSWPNYENCSAVTFGVSLVQEEEEDDLRLNAEDLEDMWETYSTKDPFSLRLGKMGIREFNPPDSSALTAWLVIAGGVVISMAMLAFVLWRYSCFEDYTRMQAYSETASVHDEKRHLDLYPTPHQTLPPLYAENEYKWHDEDSTRVDMGGFANRSYARENMYDFESDEEVVAPRDRNGAVTAKDAFCNV